MTLNTNTATSWRKKWMPNLLQEVLHKALVADKICTMDYSDVFYIENPYGSAATITQQAPIGTYSVATFTSAADTLTTTEEFVWSEQIYGIEKIAQMADIKNSRMQEAMAQMATSIDKYILNYMCDVGTGTYDTPVGGFVEANIKTIAGELHGKFAGYSTVFNRKYVVIEAGDVPGLFGAGAGTGFTVADSWLNNGLQTSWGGIDWFVVASGTFVSATLGTLTAINDGHRLAGIGGLATALMPGGRMQWMEKEVSGKTGVECAMAAYCGVDVWYQKRALTIDITIC